ncbi:MAG: response regulator transcription factor [Mucispirillum sp.]|nr:response regulator transcription factor [Mucispirillum sp.]
MSLEQQNKKILVVDDDKEICELLDMFLTLEKYDVVSANTGLDGLDKFHGGNFDVILLDISLPDINGQQLCKLIRKESDIPIIMVSANDSVSDKVICLEFGADDYISKPFENMELIARIKAVLRRADMHSEKNMADKDDVRYFHGLKISFTGRQVTSSDGKPLKLTPKEFDLLAYMADHLGETLNRDKIIEDLWGKNTLYRWSRSLDVHIQNIRQKIEKNPKNPSIIQTVSGIGYRISKGKS